MTTKRIRDQLLGQSVTRGIGSGIAANQKIAGAADPREAARLATRTPQEVQREAEKQAEEDERRNRRLTLIQAGIEDGFTPSVHVEESFKNPEVLDKIYEEYEEWSKEQILKEEDDHEEYRIDPSDPLYNPLMDTRRRKVIEDRLNPLEFEQMIFQGYCDQEVIIRDNFRVVFRTLTTNQSLWIESMTLELKDKSMQYGRHWMSLIQLAVSIQTINDKPVAPSMASFVKSSQEKEFKKALQQRMDYIGNLPQVLSDDLIVQFTWFLTRVRQMMTGDVVEKVGNS